MINKTIKYLNLKPSDMPLIFVLCTIALISNVFLFPLNPVYEMLSIAVLGLIALRLYEKGTSSNNDAAITNTETKAIETVEPITGTIEQRSAQEIINEKLQGGIIENAIDMKFDKMIESVVDDLFGNYGDLKRKIEAGLKATMNPYIDQYDFSQHSVKLEHLLTQMVKHITQNQDTIAKNVRNLMCLEPIDEIKMSEVFDKFTEHIGENIETSELDIDHDDTPSYQNLTAHMTCKNEDRYGLFYERKAFTFSCEEDDKFGLVVGIIRSKDEDNDAPWRIDNVKRRSDDDDDGDTNSGRIFRNTDDITTLDVPLSNLRELNDMEVYLLKLHYDRTSIILDETEITDEDVEVKAEPEYSLS